jgi:hypothetical protein
MQIGFGKIVSFFSQFSFLKISLFIQKIQNNIINRSLIIKLVSEENIDEFFNYRMSISISKV